MRPVAHILEFFEFSFKICVGHSQNTMHVVFIITDKVTGCYVTEDMNSQPNENHGLTIKAVLLIEDARGAAECIHLLMYIIY